MPRFSYPMDREPPTVSFRANLNVLPRPPRNWADVSGGQSDQFPALYMSAQSQPDECRSLSCSMCDDGPLKSDDYDDDDDQDDDGCRRRHRLNNSGFMNELFWEKHWTAVLTRVNCL